MRHIIKIFRIDGIWRMTKDSIQPSVGDLVEVHNLDGSIEHLLVRNISCRECALWENNECIRCYRIQDKRSCILGNGVVDPDKGYQRIEDILEDL